MSDSITDAEFDAALVSAAMRLAGEQGWHRVNPVAAAREAGLSVAHARVRFPTTWSILARFGQLADQAVLEDVPTEGSVRDRLFHLLMRRFDALQAHRAGVLALMRALPSRPETACLLSCATRNSMRWMLQAAGVSASGLRGRLQAQGLMAVWLWALRRWERDASADLSGTMRALDHALTRAEQVAGWLGGRRGTVRPPEEPGDAAPPEAAPGAGEEDPAHPVQPPGDATPPPGPAPGELDPSRAATPPRRDSPPAPGAGEPDPSRPPPATP